MYCYNSYTYDSGIRNSRKNKRQNKKVNKIEGGKLFYIKKGTNYEIRRNTACIKSRKESNEL